MSKLGKIETAIRVFRDGGIDAVKKKLNHKRLLALDKSQYEQWVKLHGTINDAERERLCQEITLFERKPLISVLLPVFNIDEIWLRRCIESVCQQTYSNWELCIADDHSTEPHVRLVLEEYRAVDDRIKVVFRSENGHISAASNSCLEIVTGEFVVLLDHDDELSEDALFWVASEINGFPDVAMIYSDEDKIDERGRRYSPAFKPDWSRDLFYSLNMVTHLSAYRTDDLRGIGGFRIGFEGSQDYDLALRFIEQISEVQIRHIPRVLYHWRAIEGSVALSGDEKPYAHERARQSLREHFERMGLKVEVNPAVFNLHEIRYKLPDNVPKISIILRCPNSSDGEHFARHIRSRTHYTNFEIVFADGSGSLAARLNEAVKLNDCEILCFLDPNLEPCSADWLTRMVEFVMQEKIGAVGGKILDTNHAVLGGGTIIGVGETVGIANRDLPGKWPGSMFRNVLPGNFSAVSGTCMMVRRKTFVEAGTFEAAVFPDIFSDVDLCLKLGELGYRNLLLPFAEFIDTSIEKRNAAEHSLTPDEVAVFKMRWQKYIDRDPFYNPNLSKEDGRFSVAI